jgi:hypothetical protein
MGNETWYLVTRTDRVQFYLFEVPQSSGDPMAGCVLIDEFDRSRLPAAGDKKTAASWAKRLGLKSWTYVRI